MSMTVGTALWSKRKFGCISLALSLAETFIVYGTALFVQISGQTHAPPLMLKIAATAWLVGGLGSLGFAVAGLIADSHRTAAFCAVIVTIVTFFICGLQMLV